jgi:hypothetical protein
MRLLRFIIELLKPHHQTFRNTGKKREAGWWPASPGFL